MKSVIGIFLAGCFFHQAKRGSGRVVSITYLPLAMERARPILLALLGFLTSTILRLWDDEDDVAGTPPGGNCVRRGGREKVMH
jgi:hypothetical protein